ncbi:25151_t:CDS:2, partial [Gigaspora rosea]
FRRYQLEYDFVMFCQFGCLWSGLGVRWSRRWSLGYFDVARFCLGYNFVDANLNTVSW